MIRPTPPILKPSEWHPADQAAWSAAIDPGTPPFVPPGCGCRWSVSTRRAAEQSVGRFLAWTQERHGSVKPLGDAYDINAVRDFLFDLAATSSKDTLRIRVEGIGRGLEAITGQRPRDDLRRLRAYLSALDLGKPPRRADIPLADDLFELGVALMRAADRPDPKTANKHAIVSFRDGLMIALLATHPLRLGVFTDLTLQRDIRMEGGRVAIEIAAARQKARRGTGGPMMSELVEPLVHYLDIVRPWLLSRRVDAADTQRLWITDRGAAIDESTVHKMIRRRTKAGLGREIGPHKFRHAAATYIAIRTPEKIGIMAGVLSHRRLSTGQAHYNLASSVEAFRRFTKVLRAIKQTAD